MSMFNSPLPPKGARAGLLARYSDGHQNPLSADDQLDVLRRDCEKLGWEVVGEFKDEAKSGRSISGRAGYLDMMSAAEAGLFDVICVFHLDRLGRNARELHDANNRLSDVNAVIYTHDRGVMSRFEFSIYAEVAQMESERIAERTTRGRLAAVGRGKIMGDIPYGYREVDEKDAEGTVLLNSRGQRIRRVEIDPETAPIVLRANLDFHAGKSPHKIAIEFMKEGIPSPQGKKIWSPNTIVGTRRSMCGLIRNPMIIGKIIHGKVKTHYDQRTGKITKRIGDIADRIETDAPWLRIVPQEIWDANQARLEDRAPSKLIDKRRPTYLLSGLVKCGTCGGPFVQLATKMGCTARHMKACSNGRRVKREDLERVVLEAMTQKLTEPAVVKYFIPEYLRERGSALAEGDDRHERAVKRLAAVGREIDHLVAQVKSGAGGFAAKIINENLEQLGSEKERLDRQVRAGPATPPATLTTGDLIRRLEDLLFDLGTALDGDERDATRAREIIRSLIARVIVTPYDDIGMRLDGRGTGAVRVKIEGEVSRLVDQAMLDRKIMHVRGAGDMHDLPIAMFEIYVDLDRTLSAEQEGLWRDVAAVARLLDDADWPVLWQEMIDAMNDRRRKVTTDERTVDEGRARLALAQLRRDNWARAVRLGGTHGWVWSERNLPDDEWRTRYEKRGTIRATPDGTHAEGPIGVVRFGAPDAELVLIGPKARQP